MYDYSKLKGRIIEKYGSQKSFAKSINRTGTYVSMVLNGHSLLAQDEIDKWADSLEIETDRYGAYFFAR